MPTCWRAALAIVPLVCAACTSDPNPGEGPAPASASSSISIESLEVDGLAIDEPDWKADGANWHLQLSWVAPDEVAIDHYEIRRDGVTVDAEVDGTTFRDEQVEPGARYRYEVVGVGIEGGRTRSVRASIKTDEPRTSDARLAGSFAVRMVVRRASGTDDPVRGGGIFFGFDPRCRSGPCPVRWTVRNAKTEGTLDRDDGVYSGNLRTPLFVRNCFGAVIDEAIDVRLRVKAAAPLRGEWRATKIEGTIDEVSSFGGCMTATIHWNVRGSLQT